MAVDNQYEEMIKESFPTVDIIRGGSTRNSTIYKSLQYIKSNYECSYVIILDSARPMINSKIVDLYIIKLEEYDSVITGQHIVDSIGCDDQWILDRKKYYLIQAPEAFNFTKLFNNFDSYSTITATNQQMPQGSSLFIYYGFENNVKITYPRDLDYCKLLMESKY